MKKRVIAFLMAVAMLLCFAACGGSSEESPETTSSSKKEESNTAAADAGQEKETVELIVGDGDYTPSDETLRIAHKGNPTGLCILNVSAVSNNNPCAICLYDQLLSYDYKTNEVGPELATEWTYLDDTHIEFTLRDDVYSHAGDHMTANDVLYSVTTAKNSGQLSKYYDMFNLDECYVKDDTHVVLATNNVEPFFLYSMSNTPMSILVEASVEKNGGLDNENLNPTAGTGPYKFVEWADGAYINFERNDDYWDGQRYYKNINILVITDSSSRVINLESGDADLALAPDTASLANLEGRDDLVVVNIPTANITYFSMNTSYEPFADGNVRKAIAHAIDYENDLRIAANNYGSLTKSFLPTGSSAYISPEDGGYESHFVYDVDLAKEYMAKSGYPDGFEFSVIYPEGNAYQGYAELIQNQLKVIGITMNLEPMASSVFYEHSGHGEFNALILNNANPNPSIIFQMFDPLNTYLTVDGNNGSSFIGGPEELGELIAKANVCIDETERADLYKQITCIIAEECNQIPLYSPNFVCAANSDLVNLSLTVYGDIDFSNVYRSAE